MSQSHYLSARALRVLTAFSFLLLALAGFPSQGQSLFQFPGSTAVTSTSAAQVVTVRIARAGSLDSIKVRTQGNDGFDYKNAGGGTCASGISYSPGQMCTLQVVFAPTAPGQRLGAVVLLDSNNVVLGTQWMSGTALGSQGTFVPAEINTTAGDSTWIYAGDGNPANLSPIFLPFGVAVDAAGDLFIADSSNNRIRRVDATTGLMSTIAGNGMVGATGDGGPAKMASISNPTSVVVDAAGNVYFSDNGNSAVRRINAFDGTLTTVAGTLGNPGYGGDKGAATSATLNAPNGISLDPSGNLYIADTTNNAVRMVNAATGIITTVAGTGSAGFSGDGGLAVAAMLDGPWGVTVSPTGSVYIADQTNNRIRLMDASGKISTVVGSGAVGYTGDKGPATAATLNVPAGVAIDAAGNVYVADSGNNVVRKVNAQTGLITTIAGGLGESITGDGGPADMAGLYGPYTLALDSQGSLYIADVFHNRIRKVSNNMAVLQYGPIREGRVSSPMTQTLENDGNAPLNIAAMTAVTNSQVDAGTTTCSSVTPLAVLAQCVVGADFAPTQIGNPVIGTISVTGNPADFPGTISLEGQVLDVDVTTVTLTSSANPSVTGSAVTFNVTVSSPGNVPTGTISLLDGTNVLATGALGAGGTVSFNVSTLTHGQHSMTATYPGDSSNAAGSSTPLIQVVKDPVAPTTTTISSNSNPVFAGASLTLTAQVQVAVAGSGNGTLSGSVNFKSGSALLGSAVINNGTATLNVTTLPVGQDSIVATYSGDDNYGSSSSSPLLETVRIASTQTALSSSINPSPAGGSVTLNATTSGNGGVPGGSVSFADGATVLGTAKLNGQGVATLNVTGNGWTVGTHSLVATYAGDASDSGSVSSAYPQIVNLAATSVKIASSLNPSALGAAVTFTATVAGNGGQPTGSVQFFDGATSLGSGTVNGSGIAVVSVTSLSVGSHNITAVYGGDSFNGTSTSSALSQVVVAATIAAALTTNQNPATYGTALVLTATVTGTGSAPVGTVAFTDGTTALGTVPLNANGTATFSTSTLAIGAHTLTGAYSGDANHAAINTNTVNLTVVQGTTTSLTASTQASIAGTPVTWTAAVTGSNGKPLTGTVAIMDGKTVLGTPTLNGSGVATLTSSALAPGQHSIVASYSGDTLNAISSSAPVGDIVTIATTAATLASSANPSFSGTPLVFTATVSGNGGAPTGNVAFLDGSAVIGTVPLNATGTALLTTSTLTPGLHSITASYVGDADDQPAVSAALNQDIAEKTSVSLASSANPSLLGDTVTYTVTVSNGQTSSYPTGQVTLTDGGNVVASAPLSSMGVANFPVLAPSLGQHAMVATYAGDTQNVPATSPTLSQIVTLRPTTTSLISSSTAVSTGQQLILVSVVAGAGSQPPSGTVTFASGTTVFGKAAINASGVATLTVVPQQGVYKVVGTYSGDAQFAASSSTPAITVTVGPPIEFNLNLTPPTISMQSGSHGTLQISIATAATFQDTIAFGCAGLPASATCTFSSDKMAVGGGAGSQLTVVVDTGNPLGSGPTAQLGHAELQDVRSTGVLACMLPCGGLLALLLGRRKYRRPLGLLAAILMLAGVATLSGCGSTVNTTFTPAGSYTFQIVGTGQSTGATQAANVQLTVTQ